MTHTSFRLRPVRAPGIILFRAGRILRLGVGLSLLAACPLPALDWHRWRGPDANGISRETDWMAQWPAEGPNRVWKANVGTGFSSVAVSGGRVYTMGNQGKQDTVVCLDANTGAVRWKHAYDAPMDPKYYEGGPSATPTVDGERVYTLSKRGVAFCLETATGRVVWSKNLTRDLGVEIPTWGFA